jgi:AcrR family transcriptional regulator
MPREQQQRKKIAPNARAGRSPRRRTGAQFARRQIEVAEKAAELFASRGYDATSIGDIADEVGLLKGSLYYYAPSKEELLYSIIKEVEDAGVQMVLEHSTSDDDPLTRLRAFITQSARFVATNRAKTIVAMRDFRSLDPDHQAELSPARHASWRFIRGLIIEARQSDLIAPEVDPTVATMAILGAINQLPTWYEIGRPPSLSRVAEGFANHLVDGLTA